MVDYYDIYEKMDFLFFSNSKNFPRGTLDLCRKFIDYRHQRTTGSPIETAHGWNSVSMQKNARRVGKFFEMENFEKFIFHTHSSWRSWVLPASYRVEKPQKYHSKVVKSSIFPAKCMVSLVRTSPIETGHSRHAYRGAVRPRRGLSRRPPTSSGQGVFSCQKRLQDKVFSKCSFSKKCTQTNQIN